MAACVWRGLAQLPRAARHSMRHAFPARWPEALPLMHFPTCSVLSLRDRARKRAVQVLQGRSDGGAVDFGSTRKQQEGESTRQKCEAAEAVEALDPGVPYESRWAPYDRIHGPGQGQFPEGSIRPRGYMAPDARRSFARPM